MRIACLLFLMTLFCFGLASCKSSSPPEATADAKRYDIKGKVVSSDKINQKVTIAHEAIPGYMEAMTMPLTLHEEWIYDVATPGSTLQGTLVVDQGKSWIENATVTQIVDSNLAQTEESGIEPSVGAETPDFKLVNQDGKKIGFKQYRGKNLLLTFIYTRCPLPDYCPLMTSNFAQIARELEKNPELQSKTHLLSITVDPAYDTPKVLREYGAKHATGGFKNWEFASGSPEEIKAVAQFFGLNYWQENDQIIHGLRTAIIGPDGKVVKSYRGNEWKPAQVIEDLTK